MRSNEPRAIALVRSVRCEMPARLGLPPRSRELTGRCAWWTALLTASVGVVGLSMAPRRMHCCYGESKEDIASGTVKKYAYEAYPAWRAMHPGTTCPSMLLELNEYMNNKDDRDPWGGQYKMTCRLNEQGEPAIVVRSLGEDGIAGTADDIRSD